MSAPTAPTLQQEIERGEQEMLEQRLLTVQICALLAGQSVLHADRILTMVRDLIRQHSTVQGLPPGVATAYVDVPAAFPPGEGAR